MLDEGGTPLFLLVYMHFVKFLQVVVQASFSLRLTNESDIITAVVCTVDGGLGATTIVVVVVVPLPYLFFVGCWTV